MSRVTDTGEVRVIAYFASMMMILIGTFLTARWWAVAACFGVILAALYLLWAYQRVFHGEPTEENLGFAELKWKEGLVLAPLIAIIVFIGVYPKPMLDRIQPSVAKMIEHVELKSDYVEPDVATNGVANGGGGG